MAAFEGRICHMEWRAKGGTNDQLAQFNEGMMRTPAGEGQVKVDFVDRDRCLLENDGTAPINIRSLALFVEAGTRLWLEDLLQVPGRFPYGDGIVLPVIKPGAHNPILVGCNDGFPAAERPFALRQGHRIDLHLSADPYPVYQGFTRGQIGADEAYAAVALDVSPAALWSSDINSTHAVPFDLPETRRLLNFFRIGAGSADYTLDDWVISRFGNRIPVLGVHALGRIPWGDVDCNHHYDLIGCAMSHFLRTGSKAAWDAASIMAWRHLQTGVRLGGNTRDNGLGLHEYEKSAPQPGNNSYTGSGPSNNPAESHAWDGLMVWAFLSADVMGHAWAIERAMWLATRLPTDPYLWQGAGGSRYVGWYARNCRIAMTLGYWPATVDKRAFAINLASRVMNLKEAIHKTKWLPNAYTPFGFKPWMDAIAYAELLKLMHHTGADTYNVGLYNTVKAGAIWNLENTIDPDTAAAPYEVFDWPNRVMQFAYQATITAWQLPLLAMFRDRPSLAGLYERVRDNLVNWLDVTQQGASSAGSAAVKVWAESVLMLQSAHVASLRPAL